MEILFFSAAGCMGKGMLIEADLYGDYWSSSLHISDPTCAYVMFLGDLVGRGGVTMGDLFALFESRIYSLCVTGKRRKFII